MLLVIDNYDSFTYNLVQYLGELGADVVVRRNDAVTVDEVGELAPDGIVLSPGPCAPAQAGVTVDVIRAWGATTPILGVCLGHQAIGEAYGGRVVRAARAVHGKTSQIAHDGPRIASRRRHGRARPDRDPRATAQDASGVGRTVPSRVRAHAARQAAP